MIREGKEHQIRHELDHVTGSAVLTSLLIVFLVEAPNELLEDRPHGVVVESRDRTSFAVETGLGPRLTAGSRNFSIRVPSVSDSTSRGI